VVLVRSDPDRQRDRGGLDPQPEDNQKELDHLACKRRLRLARSLLGNGTGSRALLRAAGAPTRPVLAIEERGSTLAARSRYWQRSRHGLEGGCCPRACAQPPRPGTTVVAQLLVGAGPGPPP